MFICRLRGCCYYLQRQTNTTLRKHRRPFLHHDSQMNISQCPCVSIAVMKRNCSSLSDGRVSSNDNRPFNNTDENNNNMNQMHILHELSNSAENTTHQANTTRMKSSTQEGGEEDNLNNNINNNINREEEELRQIGRTLRDAAESEIKAEIERDSRDGTTAIPPLAPLGWKVQHPAGSNYFIMTRTLIGGVKSSKLHARRYQSVHEAFLQAMKEKQQQQQQQGRYGKRREGTQTQTTKTKTTNNHTVHNNNNTNNNTNTTSTSGEEEDAHKFNDTSKRMTIGYNTGNKRSAVLQEIMDNNNNNNSDDASCIKRRADVHLTLFAPFRVYDPSSHDPTVNICEWSSFDLLVRKTTVKNRNEENMSSMTSSNINDGNKIVENPLESMAHLVEESGLSLFIRLASVDSEMRIRSVQLLSRRQAQALEEHVCFGKGESIFLELLRSYRQPSTTISRLRSVRRYDDPLTHAEVKKQSHVLATTGINNNNNNNNNNNSENAYASSTAVSYSDAYELLMNCFDSGGEYSRALCYNGPCISELSKEMIIALHEYLQGDLGVSSELCEYVCQMQFFLEQEEYMSWLGRVRHLASVVSQ